MLPVTTSEEKLYAVTRLNRANLHDLARLHGAVYGPVAEDHYPKKYDTIYTGVAYVGFIAYNLRQEPIAYYGVLPCFIKYRDKVALASQSADTMTHPGYRFKGLFVELSLRTFELCRELGIELIFGFPNENSYHGAINKLGWQLLHRMDCFTIRVRAIPFAKHAGKNKFINKIYKFYSEIIIRQHLLKDHAISNPVLDEGLAGVYRTAAYNIYKKGFSKARTIGVEGASMTVSIRQVLLVGDMENVNESNFRAVIAALKKLAARLGIQEVQFHSSPGTALHGLFKTYYTATPSYPVLLQDLECPVPVEKLRFCFADIDIF
jgi:GNAT superfamily N-acetyltransferase